MPAAPPPPDGVAALVVTAPPPIAVAELASPFNGSTMTAQQFAARPYIDVTFLTNGLGTIDETTIDGDEIRLTGAVGNLNLVTKNGMGGFIPGLPTKINATTWRYFLTPRLTPLPAATAATMFQPGAINVEFVAVLPTTTGAMPTYRETWRVKTRGADGILNTADDGVAKPGRGQGTITVAAHAARPPPSSRCGSARCRSRTS